MDFFSHLSLLKIFTIHCLFNWFYRVGWVSFGDVTCSRTTYTNSLIWRQGGQVVYSAGFELPKSIVQTATLPITETVPSSPEFNSSFSLACEQAHLWITCEWWRVSRPAKRSGGAESGDEAPRKWTHFLVSRLRRWFRTCGYATRLCSNVSLLTGYIFTLYVCLFTVSSISTAVQNALT